MNHYFRKTAAFALTGAMLASSIPLPSFAEEDIPEVDDLPAIAESVENNTDEIKTATEENNANETESPAEKSGKSEPKVQLDSIDKLTAIDKIDFTFTVSDSFAGEITERVADIGEEVKGTLNHYIRGTAQYQYHILTLSGAKGQVSLWRVDYGSLQNTNHYTNEPMYFYQGFRVEDNQLVRYDPNEYTEYKNDFYVQVKASGDNINEVSFNYKPYSQTKNLNERMKGAQLCENVDYTAFSTDEISLKDKFEEKDEEKIIKEEIERNRGYDVTEQDPERYVTVVKGERNDGRMLGYSINFIAEIPFENKNSDYSYLGNNLKLALIGLENTLDGKVYRNDVMVRLAGDKGCLWFKVGDGEFGKNDDGTQFVKSEYNSLISFDGYQRVYNTINHKSLNVELTFSGENMELDKAVLVDGSYKYSFNADQIKYIGGGKSTYEKLW